MSIDLFDKLIDMFGEEAAKVTLVDVQEGRVREETLWKYLGDDKE